MTLGTLLRMHGGTREKPAEPVCGMCRRRVAPGTACVSFPTYHARCIERAVAHARSAG
ncbi:hypothetical protein HY251_12060 [bacterium]|nr:hypothetical protein [bacterium]